MAARESRLGHSKFTCFSLPEREVFFWTLVDKSGECWIWNGLRKQNGYGKFCWNKKVGLAHRFCWLITHGEIPEGKFVCHHCDNPTCVNPSHLFLGSPKDNVSDMWAKGRASSPPHPNQKLSAQAVQKIRLSRESQKSLAQQFSIHPSVISRIRSGVSHRSIQT
jgi:hypothetical protein